MASSSHKESEIEELERHMTKLEEDQESASVGISNAEMNNGICTRQRNLFTDEMAEIRGYITKCLSYVWKEKRHMLEDKEVIRQQQNLGSSKAKELQEFRDACKTIVRKAILEEEELASREEEHTRHESESVAMVNRHSEWHDEREALIEQSEGKISRLEAKERACREEVEKWTGDLQSRSRGIRVEYQTTHIL